MENHTELNDALRELRNKVDESVSIAQETMWKTREVVQKTKGAMRWIQSDKLLMDLIKKAQ